MLATTCRRWFRGRSNADASSSRARSACSQRAASVTIHKGQGLSLDPESVDLEACFAPGQAYVACSRARKIEGLNIERWDGADSFRAAPEFLAFIRTPFAVAFRIGDYDFLAVNAHLHYGHYVSDRRLEGRALADWIVSKVRATESLNAVLFGVPAGPTPAHVADGD